jgi:hypothetical protein
MEVISMKYPTIFFIAAAIVAVAWPAMAADNAAIIGGSGVGQPAKASAATQPVVSGNAAATQPVAAGAAAATQPTIVVNSEAIEQSSAAIAQATTLDGAKAAYESGLTYGRSNQDLRQAYVRKLGDLGLCKDAYVPAQALYNLNPQSTLALGVIAVNEGLDGRMNAALHDISDAVIMGTQEPLVLATAGRLYAWYDVRPLADVIGEGVKNLVASARAIMSDNEIYKTAYYAASQDPTQQPFGHVVLTAIPGVPRAVVVETTGPLASPPAAAVSAEQSQYAMWYRNFTWFEQYVPPGYRSSPGPVGTFPRFAFPGSALGNAGGAMPHMRPPTFNTGFVESGASAIYNWPNSPNRPYWP